MGTKRNPKQKGGNWKPKPKGENPYLTEFLLLGLIDWGRKGRLKRESSNGREVEVGLGLG
jgi:hypothetical protein